jgi:hypothetical protein
MPTIEMPTYRATGVPVFGIPYVWVSSDAQVQTQMTWDPYLGNRFKPEKSWLPSGAEPSWRRGVWA